MDAFNDHEPLLAAMDRKDPAANRSWLDLNLRVAAVLSVRDDIESALDLMKACASAAGAMFGPESPEFFSASGSYWSCIAENTCSPQAVSELDRLSSESRQVLGGESLLAFQLEMNAAAFAGMAGDEQGASDRYIQLADRANQLDLPVDVAGRLTANQTHWIAKAGGVR